MNGKVYIVHCIDTEGPLYETPIVPFERIKDVFGITIEPTKENLIKLQKGEYPLDGKEEAVKNLVDKNKITTKGDWDEIQKMLAQITSDEFRNACPDSYGHGWIYNWFCMDHVGFTGNNPRHRDAGHHKIFDRYMKMVSEQNKGDCIGFHHHPVSYSGNYNDSGTAFWGSENLNQIYCRKIIDRQWFPVVFRPGFHTERPDSNFFLEQWIPFDYGNQAVHEDTQQLDCANGRFGDWRHAPVKWYPYHPNHDDYQKEGTCRRWITKCLNMYARIRQLSLEDVDDAFKQAASGMNAILAFTDHDYKDMIFEINRVRDLIKSTSIKYSDVDFIYSDAVSAMRNCLNLKPETFELTVKITKNDPQDILRVKTSHAIFGPQPFLAIKDKQGRYYWDNFDFAIPGKEWTYTFDNNTVFLNDIDVIGVAANNAYGYCECVKITELTNDTKVSIKRYFEA